MSASAQAAAVRAGRWCYTGAGYRQRGKSGKRQVGEAGRPYLPGGTSGEKTGVLPTSVQPHRQKAARIRWAWRRCGTPGGGSTNRKRVFGKSDAN